jgi:cytoskeletal protein CcmA (bactofilin family)
LFSHDDDHFTDAPPTDSPSEDAQDDAEWEATTPSWRSRIASASDQHTPAPGQASGSGARRGTSTISNGASISGTLRSEDPLYIEGVFEGEIYASGDVTVALGANVNARVQAIRMTVAGSFKGSVACTDRFEALDTGVVEARIFAPALVVHDGAKINGAFQMRIADDDAHDDDEDAPVEG